VKIKDLGDEINELRRSFGETVARGGKGGGSRACSKSAFLGHSRQNN